MSDAHSPERNAQSDSAFPSANTVPQNQQKSKQDESRAEKDAMKRAKKTVETDAKIANPDDWVKGLREVRAFYAEKVDEILRNTIH